MYAYMYIYIHFIITISVHVRDIIIYLYTYILFFVNHFFKYLKFEYSFFIRSSSESLQQRLQHVYELTLLVL